MFFIVLLKLLLGSIAAVMFFAVLWATLRVFDLLLGVSFKEGIAKVKEDSVAMSIYYSTRFLGSCIALGLIICIAFIM